MQAFEILKELRPTLDRKRFLNLRQDMMARSYCLYGLYVDGELVCVAGFILQPHIERGTEFWVHDLVSKGGIRSKGYGLQLMQYLETIARDMGCSRLLVHTQNKRADAQRFYENKLGYSDYAVVFEHLL